MRGYVLRPSKWNAQELIHTWLIMSFCTDLRIEAEESPCESPLLEIIMLHSGIHKDIQSYQNEGFAFVAGKTESSFGITSLDSKS